MMFGPALGTRLLVAALSLSPLTLCAQATQTPLYDAVSVKPHHATGDPNHISIRVSIDDDRYLGDNVSLKQLIQYAYDLTTEDQIIGVTGPVGSARFDIQAKIDADTVAALKKLPQKESSAQRRLMMQALLADRFQLKVHRETREMSTYALVIAKSGLKLKEADPSESDDKGPEGHSRGGSMMTRRGNMTAVAVPIQDLVAFLSGQLHHQVFDQTGLKGKYDIELKWTPDDAPADSSTSDSGPSIYTALQEQLGLKLDSTKGPVETIVVDHAEQPSEN